MTWVLRKRPRSKTYLLAFFNEIFNNSFFLDKFFYCLARHSIFIMHNTFCVYLCFLILRCWVLSVLFCKGSVLREGCLLAIAAGLYWCWFDSDSVLICCILGKCCKYPLENFSFRWGHSLLSSCRCWCFVWFVVILWLLIKLKIVFFKLHLVFFFRLHLVFLPKDSIFFRLHLVFLPKDSNWRDSNWRVEW